MDVILLSGLFYFGGGTPSGIGNLLIVAVAIANILLRGRVGFFIAAVAATGLIYLTFYLSISRSEASSQYVRGRCARNAVLRRSLSRPGTDSAPAGQRDSGPPARRGGRQPRGPSTR